MIFRKPDTVTTKGAAYAAPFSNVVWMVEMFYSDDRQMLSKIKEVISSYNMINSGSRVLAGVSGGADSRCLFEVLCALRE